MEDATKIKKYSLEKNLPLKEKLIGKLLDPIFQDVMILLVSTMEILCSVPEMELMIKDGPLDYMEVIMTLHSQELFTIMLLKNSTLIGQLIVNLVFYMTQKMKVYLISIMEHMLELHLKMLLVMIYTSLLKDVILDRSQIMSKLNYLKNHN